MCNNSSIVFQVKSSTRDQEVRKRNIEDWGGTIERERTDMVQRKDYRKKEKKVDWFEGITPSPYYRQEICVCIAGSRFGQRESRDSLYYLSFMSVCVSDMFFYSRDGKLLKKYENEWALLPFYLKWTTCAFRTFLSAPNSCSTWACHACERISKDPLQSFLFYVFFFLLFIQK